MYNPAHFNTSDLPQLHALMRAHPLGVLLTHSADGLDANHVPFDLLLPAAANPATTASAAPARVADQAQANPVSAPELGTLQAHVARANPLWRGVQSGAIGAQVLVVFRAEQGYVSPNGYPSKHVHHQQVPTWNYRVVHAHGEIRVREDRKFLLGVVGRLTRTHEAVEPQPWTLAQAPRDYLDALLGQIVGLEIAITRLEGKFKLSQNKDEADRLGAAEHVAQRGHADLAERMRGR
jgi:transcriptional regulator